MVAIIGTGVDSRNRGNDDRFSSVFNGLLESFRGGDDGDDVEVAMSLASNDSVDTDKSVATRLDWVDGSRNGCVVRASKATRSVCIDDADMGDEDDEDDDDEDVSVFVRPNREWKNSIVGFFCGRSGVCGVKGRTRFEIEQSVRSGFAKTTNSQARQRCTQQEIEE
jgi:hypothetical protein